MSTHVNKPDIEKTIRLTVFAPPFSPKLRDLRVKFDCFERKIKPVVKIDFGASLEFD
jgi:hypothetical protein